MFLIQKPDLLLTYPTTPKNPKLYDSSLLPQLPVILPVKHFPDYFMVSVGILRSYSRQRDINILIYSPH